MQSLIASLRSSLAYTSTTIRNCHGVYPVLDWLTLYYPLVYFARVVRREPDSKHENILLYTAILGPLCYLFILGFAFSQFGEQRQAQKIETPVSKGLVPEALLQTDCDSGLNEEEVAARRERYGRNETWTGTDWLQVAMSFCQREIVLEASILLATIYRDWGDLASLSGLLVQAAWSPIQSAREYNDLATSLVGDLRLTAATIRDGSKVRISAEDLVPGDVIFVGPGTIMPADCCALSIHGDLALDQSAITGENSPVKKELGDMCYSTTGVKSGDACLVVKGTGYQTFIGRTLSLVGGTRDCDKALPQHVRQYHAALQCTGAYFLGVILTGSLVLCGRGDSKAADRRPLQLVVSLAVVSVPFSVGSMINLIRTYGSARLAEQGAIVQSVTNMDSLAGIDVLCVDRTGTLTKNELSVSEPRCFSCDAADIMLTACLALPADHQNLDPIDKAFISALEDYPRVQDSLGMYTIHDYTPFDPETKVMQATVESPMKEHIICLRGAPRSVLEHCSPVGEEIAEAYRTTAAELAHSGSRSLGVARKRENQVWELLGLVPLMDRLRDDGPSTSQLAEDLGVSIKVFTGDSAATAEAFATDLGIGSNVRVAESLLDDNDNTLVEATDVYAETFPEHKEKIVRSLQSLGYIVAATGDGVNDAPTLQRADCGIAVEGATEAAQSAADVVFTVAGISNIIRSVTTSRQVFQLVQAYLSYRTTMSLHLILVVLLWNSYSTQPLDTLLLILVLHAGDIICTSSLGHYLHTVPFTKRPARWSTSRLAGTVIPLSILLTAGTFLATTTAPSLSNRPKLSHPPSPTKDSAIAFLFVVLSDHWLLLIMRTNGRIWSFPQNRRLIVAALCVDLGATSLCHMFYSMNVATMIYVWLLSFAVSVLAAGIAGVILSGDELVHGAIF